MSAPLSPPVVLRALGVVGFVRWRLRAAQAPELNPRIPVALVGDLDLAEHLRIFHDFNAPMDAATSYRVHAVLHARTRPAVPHYHASAVSAAIHKAEATQAETEAALRRIRVGLDPDAPV